MNVNGSRHVLPAMLFLICILLNTMHAGAEPADRAVELSAVFLVEDVYLGPSSLSLVFIRETTPATYPGESAMVAGVAELFAPGSGVSEECLMPRPPVGDHQLFYCPPGDFGGVGLVDVRDGAVAFAGGVVWMGDGDTVHPTAGSHPWQWKAGIPATEPQELLVVPNPDWDDIALGKQSYFLQVALAHIRQTDVLRSFGNSAPYRVTGYLHTPSVGLVEPELAVAVLVVNGYAGPPWSMEPVETEPLALDMFKTLFR